MGLTGGQPRLRSTYTQRVRSEVQTPCVAERQAAVTATHVEKWQQGPASAHEPDGLG
jgi:hypothetical protein